MNDQKSTDTSRTRHDRGFTYIALLAAIVIIGITLSSATKYWSHIMLREKEKELIFRGNQYQNAISKYYSAVPGKKEYPSSVEDLLKDNRTAVGKRHLRKKYLDPMTGEDFVVIRDQKTRRIMGFKSKSDDEPLKKANFSEENKEFEGKSKYSEWEFRYTPQTTQPPPRPRILPTHGAR